jgi:hypothetical protein
METLLFKWIPSVGFPIVVAVYVLVRIEPRLNKLNTAITKLEPLVDAINSLTLEIAKMNGRAKK